MGKACESRCDEHTDLGPRFPVLQAVGCCSCIASFPLEQLGSCYFSALSSILYAAKISPDGSAFLLFGIRPVLDCGDLSLVARPFKWRKLVKND